MTFFSLILLILIVGVVWWATMELLAAFGVPQPIATIVRVFIVLLLLGLVLQTFGVNIGIPALRLP